MGGLTVSEMSIAYVPLYSGQDCLSHSKVSPPPWWWHCKGRRALSLHNGGSVCFGAARSPGVEAEGHRAVQLQLLRTTRSTLPRVLSILRTKYDIQSLSLGSTVIVSTCEVLLSHWGDKLVSSKEVIKFLVLLLLDQLNQLKQQDYTVLRLQEVNC